MKPLPPPPPPLPKKGLPRTKKWGRYLARQFHKLTKKAWFFVFQLITGVVLLGAMGLWGFNQIMQQVLGRYEFLSFERVSAAAFGEPRVLLLSPLRTEKYFKPAVNDTLPDDAPKEEVWPYKPRVDDWNAADTLWYAEGMKQQVRKSSDIVWEDYVTSVKKEVHIVDTWQEMLFRENISFKIIEETELAEVHGGYNIMILPAALLLSAEEKQGIKDFVGNGGNLLACWSPGTRDENGKWVGLDFMSQFFGGIPSDQINDPTGGTSLIVRGNSPITAMIPPGTHLDIFTYNGFFTLDIIEPRTQSDGYWFRPYWHGEKQISMRKNSVIARGTYLKGKFVWFSFTPSTVQPNKDNQEIFRKMLVNAIKWLNGSAIAAAKVWPAGYSSGGGLLLKANNNPEEIADILSIAEETETELDLIVEEGISLKEIYEQNYLKGDLILSTASNQSLAGRNYRDQSNWIRNQVERLEKTTGHKPTGLFPVDWDYNRATMKALVRDNMFFVMGNSEPRNYGPKVVNIKPGEWWSFLLRKVPFGNVPKVQLTMAEYRDRGVKGSKRLFNAMSNDILRVQATGGMYLGVLDTDIIHSENALNLPNLLTEKMEQNGMWRASTSKLVQRYIGWHGLRVSTKNITSRRIMISISNEGKTTVYDINFNLYLSDEFAGVFLKSEVVNLEPRDVKWHRKQGYCSFTLPKIDPGDNAVIYADLFVEDEMN